MPVTEATVFFGEHVGDGCEQIRGPRLMRRGADANGGHGKDGGHAAKAVDVAKILRRQHDQRERGDDEHGRHTRLVNGHAALDERHRDAATVNAADNGDAINNEGREHDLMLVHVELFVQVIRQPKEIKPPDAVGHEFAGDETPQLPVTKKL